MTDTLLQCEDKYLTLPAVFSLILHVMLVVMWEACP